MTKYHFWMTVYILAFCLMGFTRTLESEFEAAALYLLNAIIMTFIFINTELHHE